MPLNALPVELLLLIFSHAATSSMPIPILMHLGGGKSRYRGDVPERASVGNLHLVCKLFHQILAKHQEFAKNVIFFHRNTFISEYPRQADLSWAFHPYEHLDIVEQPEEIRNLEHHCHVEDLETIRYLFYPVSAFHKAGSTNVKIMVKFTGELPSKSKLSASLIFGIGVFNTVRDMLMRWRENRLFDQEPGVNETAWQTLEVVPVYQEAHNREERLVEQLNARLTGPWAEFLCDYLGPNIVVRTVAYYEEAFRVLEAAEEAAEEVSAEEAVQEEHIEVPEGEGSLGEN